MLNARKDDGCAGLCSIADDGKGASLWMRKDTMAKKCNGYGIKQYEAELQIGERGRIVTDALAFSMNLDRGRWKVEGQILNILLSQCGRVARRCNCR